MGKPTLKNVTLPHGVWTNLYTAISQVKGSAVAPGTPIGVSLVQRGHLQLNVGAAAPTADSGYELIRDFEYSQNEQGDLGFWAMPPFGDVTVNLKEV
jgi:hypothetical protein